jgi:undecaprenyl-diphosphatase
MFDPAHAVDAAFYPVLALGLLGLALTTAAPRRLVVALLGLVVAVWTLKALVGRARPHAGGVCGMRTCADMRDSFPSGHSACAAFLAFAAPDVLVAPAVAFAASVGWSRVRLRRHHVTDVLAGYVLAAAAYGLGCHFILR